MFYLILITFFVFVLFWLGDLYLTLKTVKKLGNNVEINPIIKFILRGRGRLVYLFKPLELIAFLYLLWFLNTFEGVIPFSILLVFIFVYSIIVVNNAHVYYKVTDRESGAFKIIFIGLTLAVLFFIYLNYLLYLDIGIVYDELQESNEKYSELLWETQNINETVTEKPKSELPNLNLPIRRPDSR